MEFNRETVNARMILGGVSLLLVGSGLVMLLKSALPDLVRYVRIRAM
jgi:hypothetical protein